MSKITETIKKITHIDIKDNHTDDTIEIVNGGINSLTNPMIGAMLALLTVFAFINFRQGDFFLMWIEIFFLGLTILSTIIFRALKKQFWLEYVLLTVLFFLLCILYLQREETAFWFAVFPALSFFSLGKIRGLIASLMGMFAIVVLYYYDSVLGNSVLSKDFFLRFVFIYFALGYASYMFEYSRAKNFTTLLTLADRIKSSEEKFRTLLTTSQPIIFAVKSDFTLDILEGKTLEVLNVNSIDFIGKNIKDAFGNNIELMAGIKDALNGETIQREILFDKLTFDIVISPWKSPDDIIIGAVGMALDISEKKIIQRQLEMARKMESVGKLAGGIAHDFNNMLGAISGYAELIKKKVGTEGSSEKILKYTDHILSASQHSSDLVYKLLAFSRQGGFQKGPIDLNDCIEEITEILKDTLGKNISVIKRLQAKDAIIIGDMSQIENAFLNLSVNARDAMPNGGELRFTTEEITINEEFLKDKKYRIPLGKYVLAKIEDTGAGIPEEIIPKIFEPFFSTKGPGKGTGLGLASVYGTVKSHGGIIEVSSQVHVGTTFEIFIPLAPDKKRSETPASSNTGPVSTGKGTISIIEDETLVRDMLENMISELGYKSIAYANGRDAIDWYRESYESIDLIIIDMVMPIIGGQECYRELKKINPDLKVIMASGYAINDEIRLTLKEGANAFIHKPFTIRKISEVITGVLS